MIARAIYCLATWLALPLALAYFWWRGRREPAYRDGWRERIAADLNLPQGVIWVHAASVGEVILVTPLVEALLRSHPERSLLLTTMTPTGRERAQASFGDRVIHRYVPLDTFGATRRFMRACQPVLAVFVETELWPNLIAAATAEQTPVVLVNASISERSAIRYARWPIASTMQTTLARISAIGAVSGEYAERFRALGAPSAQVQVTGNLKYDLADVEAHDEAGQNVRAQWQAQQRPIWVAASTHAGEETRLLEAFAQLRCDHPELLLVIAPRHPQRFEDVASELGQSDWRVARRGHGERVGVETDIVLADTLGEVPLFYAASDVAFVGGSLVPGIGGHNVLEPAALGRPFCVGPYIEDWRDIVHDLAACRAARICETTNTLAAETGAWLDQPTQATNDGAAGAGHVRRGAGALDRTLVLLESFL